MARTYDAIIVGARCAGSPTAMLLARRGYRVLMVDRATFPSDTLSTHMVHPLGVAALSRWGLLDRLVATGCPAVHTYAFDFGRFVLSGSPGTAEFPVAYCPRRTVLDKLLVDAAVDAGAEIREGFTVEDIVAEGGRVVGIKGRASGGAPVTEHAEVVVGADGRHSLVAEKVRPERYHEKPPLLAPYYTYWSGLPMGGRFETYVLPHRGFGVAPTHDGLTMIVAGWPFSEFEAIKKDVEGNYLAVLELVPEFADRLRGAKRVERFAGTPVPNFFRKPYGPGWALVGDAGYNKDPITAQGIMDAFRDAERCVSALDEALTGARPFDEAMRDYQRDRDEHVLSMYEFTCQLATLEPPPPEVQQLFRAISGNQQAMTRFAQMNAGTISPAEFFSAENVRAMTSSGQASMAPS
ncbi:NAD(P)/FAD-dependent oxidoreductase [Anaeromyxobacter oryzae]|uniref:FAD-dependent oxidoreductase n=1 Tax=Anaeromyxobacter oryzae TaxID=2918170 RepID=A0ABM7WPY7_9BACT|nr:NAD(P)/FAD-dependent oxidoreductase [Anaeromyxobacter oryzae]BDG01518.1 FAD-dependent oxidoreductase [Anaeromyxobacter oryzae]